MPTRKRGQSGWPSARPIDHPLERERGAGRTERVVVLERRGVEDGHDRVADELDDRAAFSEDDRDDPAEVRVEKRHDGRRIGPLAERREAAQVGEEDGDLAGGAAEVRPVRIGEERRGDLGREVAPEQAELADFAPLDRERLGRLGEDLAPGPRSGRTAR